jgi:hypothetical protein
MTNGLGTDATAFTLAGVAVALRGTTTVGVGMLTAPRTVAGVALALAPVPIVGVPMETAPETVDGEAVLPVLTVGAPIVTAGGATRLGVAVALVPPAGIDSAKVMRSPPLPPSVRVPEGVAVEPVIPSWYITAK